MATTPEATERGRVNVHNAASQPEFLVSAAQAQLSLMIKCGVEGVLFPVCIVCCVNCVCRRSQRFSGLSWCWSHNSCYTHSKSTTRSAAQENLGGFSFCLIGFFLSLVWSWTNQWGSPVPKWAGPPAGVLLDKPHSFTRSTVHNVRHWITFSSNQSVSASSGLVDLVD